jgi:DNA (cytosine-5)-methyltransferase 1
MLDLFSGIGGFSLAASWAGGIETVAFCEIEPYCQKVLKKHWPDVPIFEDITKLRGEDVGAVELICGGPPCQPASCAGMRRGAEDDRWLWPEAIRLVREIHPRWCVFENPTGILTLDGGVAFEHLLLELEAEGYEVQPVIIPACAVGAPHRRDRVWIVAYSQGRDDRRIPGKIQKQDEQQTKKRPQTWSAELGGASQTVTDTPSILPQRLRDRQGQEQPWRGSWWSIEPNVGRVAYGIPSRVDRLRGLGNAIVPQVAQEIFKAIVDIEARRRYTR